MHQIITKSLLLLTIVLAIVAISTPDWIVSHVAEIETVSAGTSTGLFKICDYVDSQRCCSSVPTTTDMGKDLKTCRGLGIAAVCFLFVALACQFFQVNQPCRLLGMASYLVGLILLIACVSLFANKIKGKFPYEHYGYSFDLAIGAVVTCVLVGVSAILTKIVPLSSLV